MFNEAAISLWIEKSIGTKNFKFDVENTTQKGEGCIGELLFVKVQTDKVINGKDVFHMVIKTNKYTSGLEQSVSILNEVCKREVFFYSTILKEYQDLQNGKILTIPFDMVPKCYNTIKEGGNQVIIMENLKKDGYVLHPKSQPMNTGHIEIGLQTFAKLHALSFALKDQKEETFENISMNCTSVLKELFRQFQPIFDTKTPELVKTLKEVGRPDLSIVYERFINEKSIFDRFMDLNDVISKEQAIIHADCHNGNLLFQYKDSERITPHHMVLIDFQGTCMHSPAIDVSYFLYLNLSPADFPKLTDFVEYYYNEFCSFLKELGSDASTLFPRCTFDKHLRMYYTYGLFLGLTFLEILYLDNDETPDLIDEKSNEFLAGFKDVKIKSRKQYLQRIEALVDSLINGPYA